MLNLLKRDLVAKENAAGITDIMLESINNDDIRDAFLDNVELALIGAENDAKVEKELASIPEYDEDELTSDELKELVNLEESVEIIPDFDEE